jgi:alpha-tubulin suppressor-like RCC1 family protein
MRRTWTQLGIQLFWQLGACDSGSLDSHRVQVPAKLIFTQQPTATIAGTAIRPPVAVTVLDAYGNPVTAAKTLVSVSLGNNPGSAALSGTAAVSAIQGVATFPDLSLDRSGKGYTLAADATGLSGAHSASFNASLAPTMLAFAVQPSTTGAALVISPSVTVAVLDGEGNVVESASTSVTLGIGTNPSGGALVGTVTLPVVNGVATFSNLSVDTPGTGYTLTASANGLSPVTSASFTVGGAFSMVSAGTLHTCGVTAGKAYCWGFDSSGQLGNGTFGSSSFTTRVAVVGGLEFAAVSAGCSHTCGVTPTGVAYCWGDNWYGQLGNGSNGQSTVKSQPVAVVGGLEFAAVSAGCLYSCGVTPTGVAYCWGANYSGQLGNGSAGPDAVSNQPALVAGGLTFATVSAGTDHTCGVTTAGVAYCWGTNHSGELGNGSTTDSSTPVPVAGGLTFTAASSGGQWYDEELGVSSTHSCGVTTTGAAYCWGGNLYGALGNGSMDSSTPVPVVGGLTFAMVSAGTAYSCGVTTAGTAYCWGVNDSGQLGNGSRGWAAATEAPVAVAGDLDLASVSASVGHTCGVTPMGVPYCWGANHSGELGTGSSTDSANPVRIANP